MGVVGVTVVGVTATDAAGVVICGTGGVGTVRQACPAPGGIATGPVGGGADNIRCLAAAWGRGRKPGPFSMRNLLWTRLVASGHQDAAEHDDMHGEDHPGF
jgi:hypothetical protein